MWKLKLKSRIIDPDNFSRGLEACLLVDGARTYMASQGARRLVWSASVRWGGVFGGFKRAVLRRLNAGKLPSRSGRSRSSAPSSWKSQRQRKMRTRAGHRGFSLGFVLHVLALRACVGALRDLLVLRLFSLAQSHRARSQENLQSRTCS